MNLINAYVYLHQKAWVPMCILSHVLLKTLCFFEMKNDYFPVYNSRLMYQD